MIKSKLAAVAAVLLLGGCATFSPDGGFAGIEQAAKEADDYGQKFSEEVITRMRTEMKKRGHDL